MKIRLTSDLPVRSCHGAIRGRVFDVIRHDESYRGRFWFVGDAGEECHAFLFECEEVEEGLEEVEEVKTDC
jgi:hypothetical protein